MVSNRRPWGRGVRPALADPLGGGAVANCMVPARTLSNAVPIIRSGSAVPTQDRGRLPFDRLVRHPFAFLHTPTASTTTQTVFPALVVVGRSDRANGRPSS